MFSRYSNGCLAGGYSSKKPQNVLNIHKRSSLLQYIYMSFNI